MKKTLMLLFFLSLMTFRVIAQAPPSPPSNPSAGNNGPVGGGAPVDGGILFLTALAAGYGISKMKNYRSGHNRTVKS